MPTRIDENQKRRFFLQPTLVIFLKTRRRHCTRAIYFFATTIGNFLGAIARSMSQPGLIIM
jgi:hypothetical protein